MADETPVPEDEEAVARTTRRRKTKPVSQLDGSVKMEVVPPPDGPQVEYIGTATRRILGPEDWKNLVISDIDEAQYDTHIWDLGNSKMLPKSSFSEQQLAYLKRDGRFEIDEG